MGGDGTKTTWHVGYFPKTLIRVKTEKAYKINMPSHSIYRDYIFWLPVGFVKNVIPNNEEYHYFFLPEHFEVELHLEGSDYKVTDRKKVKASYLKEVFATLTSEIKKELGIEDKEALDLINISQIKNLFLDSSIEIAQIARHSGLSRQTVNKIRQDINSLEGMKLSNLRLLQSTVAKIEMERGDN